MPIAKVSDLAAHPGRLLCLHVADGGEAGRPGGVQGQAGHNLPDLLLLLDACPGLLRKSVWLLGLLLIGWLVDWKIWLVDWSSETFQAVNFTFVPQQFRVIYIATCRWIVPPPTVCADFFMKPPQYALSELPKKISLKTPKNHKKNSVCSGWTSSASSREGKLRRRSSRLPCYVFCICLLTYYT